MCQTSMQVKKWLFSFLWLKNWKKILLSMQNIAPKQFNDTVEYQKYRKHKKIGRTKPSVEVTIYI